MKLKSIILACAMAGASASAPAADSGFYAGVDIGRSNTGSILPGFVMTKSTDIVGGITLGYQFTQNWGVEAFYTGGGKFSVSNAAATKIGSGKDDIYGLEVIGTLPLSDAFSLYGRLGYASTKTSASSSPAALAGATRSAATYGLGGQYDFNPTIGIRAGWDRYGAATAGGITAGVKNNFNINLLSLGIVFRFQ